MQHDRQHKGVKSKTIGGAQRQQRGTPVSVLKNNGMGMQIKIERQRETKKQQQISLRMLKNQ